MSRVARATISTAALRDNLVVARTAAPGARVMAVLKSNGYGHGLLKAAAAFSQADGFAVSCLAEAIPLRDAGHRQRILLLEGFFDAQEIEAFARFRLDPVIHSRWQIELLRSTPPAAPVDVWLKVDSGMHRLGFPPEDAAAAHAALNELQCVASIRFLTHLAHADDRRDDTTRRQVETFSRALGSLSGERSLANSAATLGWPETHGEWVRPGIMLYGCSPFEDAGPRPPLRHAMTVEARLIAIRQQSAGDRIGYGGTFTCPEAMPVGVVSIGYGDGYPRHAPNGTPMLVNGIRATLAGRVSMDMITVDLRSVPEARVGDPVVLWGDESLRIEEVARYCGTIGYELTCQLTTRVEFRYHP